MYLQRSSVEDVMCEMARRCLTVGGMWIPTPLEKTQRSVGIQHPQVWNPGSGPMQTLLSFISPESMKELAFKSFNFVLFTGRCSTMKAL